MQVRHDRGRIIEENHYYAFGLKIAGISSKAYGAPNNNYLYQGDFSDFDDDLGWNDFELRSYDPQIGRFLQNDPYDQFASGYVGMGNDPVNGVDEDGGLVGDPVFNAVQTLQNVAVIGIRHLPAAAKIGGATIAKIGLKVLDVATDFIPLVSGAKDIYKGVKSGNWWQAGLGVLSIAADVFTLGGSTLSNAATT